MIHNPPKRTFPQTWLALITLALLIPFAGKAFHLDDPLFLWAAGQIQAHPLDFYGFTVNWYGTPMPMAEVTKNPPLFSYYLALVTGLFGWSETVVHLACYLPAAGVAVGTHALAEELGIEPVPAALAAICNPIFLVSGTTVMCDITMLSLWLWALVFWLRGLGRERPSLLMAGALCMAAACLTKYFAISLVPLLLVYTLRCQQRPKGWGWLAILAFPVLVLAGYQLLTARLYGFGHFTDAAGYSVGNRAGSGVGQMLQGLAGGLSFIGGGIISALFLAPLLWCKKTVAGACAAALVLLWCLTRLPAVKGLPLAVDGHPNWYLLGHFSLFVVAGAGLMLLAGRDLLRNRDGVALLLSLWLGGTFAFASLLNWTVSARNILPLVPAAGLLIARGLQQRRAAGHPVPQLALVAGLVMSLAAGLTVTLADYSWANSVRDKAGDIWQKYGKNEGDLWFQGHWGFQYYMEQAGAKPVDFSRFIPMQGDLVVIPSANTNVRPFGSGAPFELEQVRDMELTPFAWGSTLDYKFGSGFYSSESGPVPYLLGPASPQNYFVLLCTQSIAGPAAAGGSGASTRH